MKKKKTNITGNALAQYGIVIALVAIAIIPAFFIIGKNIVEHFSTFNSYLGGEEIASSDESPSGGSSGTEAGGEFPASIDDPTPDNPEITCSGNDCVIDFGDYVINGIPSDFSDYIQGSGTSGGTDLLATLLEEIAHNAPIDEESKNLILKLASEGHQVAGAERDLETIVFANSSSSADNELTEIIGKQTTFNNTLENIQNSLGVKADPDYQNTLVLVNALANDISNIATKINDETTTFYEDKVNPEANILDGTAVKDFYNLIHDGTIVTDLDSTIICDLGHGEDYGYQCN